MPPQSELSKLSVRQFAERFRAEMIPLSNTFSYFCASVPMSEEDLKEYLEDLRLSPVRSHGLINTSEQELTITFRLCSHFLDEIDAFFRRLFKAAGFQEAPIEL